MSSTRADKGGRSSQQLLDSAELQLIMSWHVIPSLDLHALATLACSCKALQSLVYQDNAVWRAAATAWLPPLHPTLADLDRQAVQEILTRRSNVKNNLASGKNCVTLQLTSKSADVNGLLFSPDCSRIAVLTNRPTFMVINVADCSVLLKGGSQEDQQLHMSP
ncbi:hypothetical protein WJX73_006285 [Symbiochloris irregularis]|uniref:F-box domain-containing protein n=1 Tax=Symbiochloris irregularis TaxID=706552 RepID=A0AAW1P9U4_9CHLO